MGSRRLRYVIHSSYEGRVPLGIKLMPSLAPKEKNYLLIKWETLARRNDASVLLA